MLKRINSGLAPTGDMYPAYLLVAVCIAGTVGPIATFLLARTSVGTVYKAFGLAAAVAGFLGVFIFLRRYLSIVQSQLIREKAKDAVEGISEVIQDKLTALDEANQFFGSSLNPGDMFRLVSSRVGDICPFDASTLFVLNESKTKLKVAFADGRNADAFRGLELDAGDGLAGAAVTSGKPEIDRDMMIESFAIPADALQGFSTAAAIPLFNGGEVFAVFQMYSESEPSAFATSANVFDAIGRRIGPLFQSSMAFEQSISSALTDVLTGLPNQRAFFMVLENQLAESIRYRDQRPLTVLCIDIKGFTEINTEHGHSAGDRMLEFTRDLIREQLRKMDFLARTMNDEFAVILPTASEKTAAEIMERIKAAFARTPCAVSDDDNVKVWLNFGWATFWKDGETANQLIRNAQTRKQQEKSEEPAGVLWFPRQYVN